MCALDLKKVRSVLSVPAHDRRKTDKARSRGADQIMWDLEDSVPADLKDVARDCIRLMIEPGDWVRTNPINSAHYRRDMELVRLTGATAVIPKVEPSDLQLIPRDCILSIESPAAVLSALHIANHSAGVVFGRWDFESTIGFPCPVLLDHSRAQIVLAAHAANVPCWDAPSLIDETTTRREASHSRALGFTGKGCVHPSQIAVVNTTYDLPLHNWHPMPFCARNCAHSEAAA